MSINYQTHDFDGDDIVHRYQDILNSRDCIVDEGAVHRHDDLHSSQSEEKSDKPRRGWVPDLSTDELLGYALYEAFMYRGDVTVTLADDSTSITGYVFDRRVGSCIEKSYIRLIPVGYPDKKIRIGYKQIGRIEFSGRDAADGKSWKHYLSKFSDEVID